METLTHGVLAALRAAESRSSTSDSPYSSEADDEDPAAPSVHTWPPRSHWRRPAERGRDGDPVQPAAGWERRVLVVASACAGANGGSRAPSPLLMCPGSPRLGRGTVHISSAGGSMLEPPVRLARTRMQHDWTPLADLRAEASLCSTLDGAC